MKKNILFIAYHFPPIGGSGVQRSLKYVKYLPNLGCNPLVVTVKNGHNFAYDYSMLNEIPNDVKVYRSNSGEMLWLRKIIEDVNKFLVKIKSKKINNLNSREENIEIKDKNETIKDKIFRYLEYNYYVPDTKIRWYKYAVKDIKKRVLKENEIDIIYSTSSPYTDHLIGLEIKKTINKPWVADFRDQWIRNGVIMDRYNDKRIIKEEKMEREIIENADFVINVTEPITEMYKKRYPKFKENFITITNGFDSADKVNIEKKLNNKFIINYSGLLDFSRNPISLIKALEKLVDYDEFKNDLELNFTGFIDEDLKNIMRKSKVWENINLKSYIEHKEIINVMGNSNINVMILEDKAESKGVFTGKIFDYILAERPILGIMPRDGVAAKLINENNIGLGVDHNNIEEIKEFILKEYNKFKKGEDNNTNSIIKCSQFDRKNLTSQLVELCDKLT